MTLADAIRSGRPFRRAGKASTWKAKRCPRWPDEVIQMVGDGVWHDWDPRVEDILADDWELIVVEAESS